MKHIKALAIKMIATLVILYVILGFGFTYSLGNLLTLTILLGIVSYILGDLLLLPRTSNLTATISDFAVAMLFTWFYLANLTTNTNNVFIASSLAATGLAIFEYFFHKYMVRNVFPDDRPTLEIKNLRYQTEASEEIAPDKDRVKRD